MGKDSTIDIRTMIKEAVNAGLRAGFVHAEGASSDAHKDTEKRLYAYPVLLNRIAENKERLQEIMENGAPERSKSIIRFSRTGVRLSQDEILDALVKDLNATIAADEHEADTIARALKTIKDDAYYLAVSGKFFRGMTDEGIAESIPCDASTVRRNRGRLMRKLAVWLYGARAI